MHRQLAKVILLLACFAFAASVSEAQHVHDSATSSKPAQLLQGLGTHTHPIATKSEMAQKFFDQGLALIYGFNHDEAARLFARAAELDPKSPMPHWGIAYALGPNYNMGATPEREAKAWEAIDRAVSLSSAAPANEQAYVAALVKRYSKDPNQDRKQLALAYREAMRELTHSYPDDLDAATLYAESMMNLRPWQLWDAEGKPAEGTLEICQVLEMVLRRYPNHPGANHYYIHTVEASRTPERALPSATRLITLMPGAGHMVHMPSHIFLRTGDFEMSAKVNELAATADKHYIERSGATGVYPLMYYSHNLHFISYVRLIQGRFQDSLEYARLLKKNVAPGIGDMPMLSPYAAFEWLVFIRFGKWDDMLAQPAPAQKEPILNAFFHYARGVAFAGLKKTNEAQAEQERLEAVAAKVSADAMLMANPAQAVLEIAKRELAARIARAKGDQASEVAHWRQAVELEDRLNYTEPPDWHYPVRQSLGGALLRYGNPAEAEAVFRKDLENNPRNGRSLFGLLEALKAQRKSDSIEWVKREFQDAWSHAQLTLNVPDL